MENQFPGLFDKIAGWCAYRERSEQEVIQKLKALELDPDLIQKLLAQLRQENFVSNERFARSFAEGKFRIKKWGRRQILFQLRKKGISADLAEEAVSFIPQEGYMETCFQLAEKKASLLKGDRKDKKIKLVRYLAGKGYEADLCFKAADKALS